MHNKLTKELAVCGYNAARAVGEHHPETINRLFLREDRMKDFSRVCKGLAERKRPYKICDEEELERICKSNHHQGVVAMIEEPEILPAAPEDIDAWAAGKTGLVLHSVGNDLNLGAIVRAAAFFEIAFIVINEEDGEAHLSTAAYRAAEGGMEHVSFRRVRSTANFLRALSREVVTVGAEVRARLRLRDLGGIVRDARSGAGVAVVLGNEETGLPGDVRNNCRALVRIPGSGHIESLNVAQAAALFLHELFER
ncbi:MAG: RNA methyltransferase [Spirochaetaceae bacterium]|jgi:TrmH RNA methyltransferase|nr:RNA methyltransferase [Spirochaetaceae bacterium]